ncbi:MAG: hypothetical protein HETSPECPRED_002100 [Heterodermia speciosa]|uniref:DUF7730 domain-containing protein n=1 Tax=Heterodermia speciosa TaxID=116794 RepID=A0A8H3J3B8_9LECA|nr:MAG: hypothetical protein HETSPECPRED_002100 [Heterodermia speciosa]
MNDNLESLLFLLRLPYFILSRLFRPSKPPPPKSSIQTREAALKRIETYEPTPLPRIRPRTLTIEDLHRSNESAFPSSEAVGEAQPSNPPFFRLPPEVRQMIYTEVLGGQTLHIIRKRNRLGFLKCRAPRREACPTKSCLGSVDGDGVWTRGVSGKEKTDGGLLDLALVSRRVYTEALTVLYAANEFYLSSLLTLFSLQRTLVPHRLAAIKSLTLYWYLRYPFYSPSPAVLHHPPPHDEATWEEFWRIMRVEMHGLRKVVVRIWHTDMSLDTEGERRMLAPLGALGVERGLKVMVWLPWKGEEGEVAEGLILMRGAASAL